MGLQTLYFGLTVISTLLVFLPLSDRVNRRSLFAAGAAMQLAGMPMLIYLPLTSTVALGYVVLTGTGIGFGAQAFFQLWSGEVFPTRLRGTAQGLLFARDRTAVQLDQCVPRAPAVPCPRPPSPGRPPGAAAPPAVTA